MNDKVKIDSYDEIYECISKLIPEIPEEIFKKLGLWNTTLGGFLREDVKGKYLEEHQKALEICRERANKIEFIQQFLMDLHQRNQEMIGCLRNTYKLPYDPHSFVDAWHYTLALNGNHRYCSKKYFDENKDKLEKNYNVWIENFHKVTHGINAVIKHFGQYENGSKGYISFYIPKFIGCFNAVFPQNFLTDYGHCDYHDDMKMSISYSFPGNGNVILDCSSYDTVCKSYTFEGLNVEFLKLISTNDKHQTFKTENYYIQKYIEDYKDFIENERYKEPNTRQDLKDLAEKLVQQMKDHNCSLTETPEFVGIMNRMLDTIRKESYGNDYKKEVKQ